MCQISSQSDEWCRGERSDLPPPPPFMPWCNFFRLISSRVKYLQVKTTWEVLLVWLCTKCIKIERLLNTHRSFWSKSSAESDPKSTIRFIFVFKSCVSTVLTHPECKTGNIQFASIYYQNGTNTALETILLGRCLRMFTPMAPVAVSCSFSSVRLVLDLSKIFRTHKHKVADRPSSLSWFLLTNNVVL